MCICGTYRVQHMNYFATQELLGYQHREHTYAAKAAVGFSADVDRHLYDVAKLHCCPDQERHIVLLMDVREDLVYDRHVYI